jgi:hypothetical protein
VPHLKIVAEVTICGVDREIETSTAISDQDIADLLPIPNIDNPGWEHWDKAEDIVITALAKEIFPNEGPTISTSDDLKRMGVTRLRVVYSCQNGNSNSLSFI